MGLVEYEQVARRHLGVDDHRHPEQSGVRALAQRANLPGRVTPHSMRKTYTTALGDAGVPLRVIDYVTGHESRGLTLGIYTAVTAEGLEQARLAMTNAPVAVGAATATRAS
ncbi:MAG: tyrosine-type recombinase/integrase [Aquihabitans sp.]